MQVKEFSYYLQTFNLFYIPELEYFLYNHKI